MEGGREWEEEGASARLAVMFRVLTHLLRALSKSERHLGASNTAAARNGLLPFAGTAMRLAEQPVDVGRRIDLTSALQGFLAALSAQNAEFRAMVWTHPCARCPLLRAVHGPRADSERLARGRSLRARSSTAPSSSHTPSPRLRPTTREARPTHPTHISSLAVVSD